MRITLQARDISPNLTNMPILDDSYINCKSARELGWTAAHLVEEGVTPPRTPASQFQISTLSELRTVYPQLFKSGAA